MDIEWHMEELDLGFTRLEIRASYAIARTIEGADIDVDCHRQVIDAIEHHLDGDYGMVLDELNTYSVRLGAIAEVRCNPRCRCLAIVAYRNSTRLFMGLISGSIGKSFKVFDSLDAACPGMERQVPG
jgi:hypothetical protein